jgi:arabinooligosaccharide transport system permease protein
MYRWGRKLTPYLFISPFFIGYAIFFIIPVIWSFNLSLYRQTGLNAAAKFVGLENYSRLLEDDKFIKAVVNTTQYALGSIFIIVPLALGLALLLSIPNLKFREFFRLFFFTPNITSGIVVGIIFGLVFEEQYGLLNNFVIQPLGGQPVRWLREQGWIMPSIILLGVWRYTGINALYFMVGLQNVSPELKEAARVDGANRWAVFRFITLPMLRPVIAFVLTFAIIGSYNLFTEPSILLRDADGGPNNAGLTITMYLYTTGFRSVKLGYAAAIGYALAIIIVVLTVLQLVLTRVFRED